MNIQQMKYDVERDLILEAEICDVFFIINLLLLYPSVWECVVKTLEKSHLAWLLPTLLLRNVNKVR